MCLPPELVCSGIITQENQMQTKSSLALHHQRCISDDAVRRTSELPKQMIFVQA
jgi:hypothetical protein